ncbi:hypothetical protein BDR26DRAFT_850299 [Obelidium mucronatum]|nr:hypothetical protein BDR26DRAFT_850299 [Obelidium mucronatum]
MSFFASVTKLASSVTSSVTATLNTLEQTAKQAASDLEQQHRMTVEAKRNAGDVEEDLTRQLNPTAALKSLKSLKSFVRVPSNAGIDADPLVQPIATIDTRSATGGLSSAAANLPWEIVCGNAREALRAQILALSQDKRNFLVSPPEGTDFKFEMRRFLPMALAILKADPELEKMRFDLVQKQIKEEVFWQNYFYRVNILQQSSILVNPDSVVSGVVAVGDIAKAGSLEDIHSSAAGAGVLFDASAALDSSTPGVVSTVVGSGDATISGTEEAIMEKAVSSSSSVSEIPDSLDDEGLAGEEYVSTESFGADWEKELQNELDEA